jgi:hypothetical protein
MSALAALADCAAHRPGKTPGVSWLISSSLGLRNAR